MQLSESALRDPIELGISLRASAVGPNVQAREVGIVSVWNLDLAEAGVDQSANQPQPDA
jgi:hypothetical protein